jgi:drug/metabolite transporter (DMT)-like permease
MLTKAQQYTFLLLISLIWGSQFIFTATLLTEYNPLQIAMLRTLIGAAALTIVILYLKESTACDLKTWGMLGLISIFEAVLPFMLIAEALKTISLGTAAILMGTIPMFTLLFDALMNKKKINIMQLLGVALGFLGMVVLFWQDVHFDHLVIDRNGEIAVLLAAVSFSFSLVLISKLPISVSPITATRNILLVAGVILLAILFGYKEVAPIVLVPSVSFNLALFFLGIFCSGFVYVLFVKLIRSTSPTFASLTNYLVPVIGVIIAILFAAEALTAKLFVVLLLVIAAAVLIENRFAWIKGGMKK